jgi:hypothetical protein
MILAAIVAALLAVQTAPPVESPAATVDEALIDRFIAALPGSGSRAVDRSPDPEELERLGTLNPGQEAGIRAVLADHRACESATLNVATERLLRDIGRRLGEAKVSRLIEFYESEDLARFDALSARISRGETLSEADTATLEALVAAYPIVEFGQQFQSIGWTLTAEEGFLSSMDRCAADKAAALASRGLRAD